MRKTGISRRRFMRRSAALGIAPLVIPASVLGKEGSPPSERISIGHIGVGGRGRGHAVSSHKLADKAYVAAVCDVRAANRERAQAMVNEMHQNEDCAAYADFREVLARDDIDAVSIAVPDHWHALIAVAAARAKKHIYSEKPLAYTVAEGRAMVDAVKKHGVIFQHGTQQRSDKNFRFACELARNGRLGALHTIRVGSPFGERGGSTEQAPVPEGLDYEFWLGPAPFTPYTPGRCDGSGGDGWYHIRDYSGGWVTAWGSHDVDIAHWGGGMDGTCPVEIAGRGEFPTEGVYDTAWKWRVECRYANGITVVYASEDENPHGVRFEGSDGWVFVNRGTLKAEPESLLKEKFSGDDVRLPVSDDHFGNFFDCIRSGAKPVAPIEAAHNSTTACHLCNIAIVLKRTLRWAPEKEQFVDDEEAMRLLARPMRAPWTIWWKGSCREAIPPSISQRHAARCRVYILDVWCIRCCGLVCVEQRGRKHRLGRFQGRATHEYQGLERGSSKPA